MKIEHARFQMTGTAPQFRVLVTGGRFYKDVEALENALDHYHFLHHFTDLAHGACHVIPPNPKELGADKLADAWAKSRDVRVMRFPANWRKYGNAAGPVRNEYMFNTFKPHLVIAFPGGAGTKHMVTYAMQNDCEVEYVN